MGLGVAFSYVSVPAMSRCAKNRGLGGLGGFHAGLASTGLRLLRSDKLFSFNIARVVFPGLAGDGVSRSDLPQDSIVLSYHFSKTNASLNMSGIP